MIAHLKNGKNSQTKVGRRGEPANQSANQPDLTDACSTFRRQQQNRQLLKCYGTFSRADHVPGHERSLKKFKIVEFIQSVFSDHNGSGRKILEIATWKLNDTL